MSAPITLVEDESRLADALASVTDDVIGVDVERADSHRYFRRAALVQVGDADGCVLLDPLAVPEPTALDELCRDRLVVLHALENDLEPMERLGVAMPRLADSGVAAALLGLPTGLTDLLHEVLGVELDTDKSRYQRADWEKRPLSQGMMEYAAGDVLHLPALWRALDELLVERGRRSWYEEELLATIATAREDTRDWERTKGAGRLDPQERAVLRALWEEREAICREHDIAPNRLVHDKTLLALAQEPAEDPRGLARRDPQRRRGPVTDHAEQLFEAQQRGLTGEPEARSESRRWSEEQRQAFDAMRRARSARADDLGVDAGVLCPSRQLRAAIGEEPATAEELAAAGDLRQWQADLLLDELWELYTEAMTPAE